MSDKVNNELDISKTSTNKKTNNENETFKLEFPINVKGSCPRCGDPKAESKQYDDDRYIKYIHRCDKIFGSNSWPLCNYCYSSGISGVQKCKRCCMALMGPIHCNSTGGYAAYGQICNFCMEEMYKSQKTTDQISKKARIKQQQITTCLTTLINNNINAEEK